MPPLCCSIRQSDQPHFMWQRVVHSTITVVVRSVYIAWTLGKVHIDSITEHDGKSQKNNEREERQKAQNLFRRVRD